MMQLKQFSNTSAQNDDFANRLVSILQQAIAERGYDAEQVDREIAAERKRELALGLDFRRPGSPAQGPGAVSGNDDDSDGEDRRDGNDVEGAGDTADEKPDPKEGA